MYLHRDLSLENSLTEHSPIINWYLPWWDWSYFILVNDPGNKERKFSWFGVQLELMFSCFVGESINKKILADILFTLSSSLVLLYIVYKLQDETFIKICSEFCLLRLWNSKNFSAVNARIVVHWKTQNDFFRLIKTMLEIVQRFIGLLESYLDISKVFIVSLLHFAYFIQCFHQPSLLSSVH